MTLNINDIRRQTIWVCKTCIKVNMKQYKAGVGSEESMQSCCRKRKKKSSLKLSAIDVCIRSSPIAAAAASRCYHQFTTDYVKEAHKTKQKQKKTKNLWTRF